MIRIYAIVGLVIALLAGGLYVQHLRSTVDAQVSQIATLQGEKAALEAAQKELERVQAARTETHDELNAVNQEVQRAEDAPVPAPIERALDGLRKLQARSQRPR